MSLSDMVSHLFSSPYPRQMNFIMHSSHLTEHSRLSSYSRCRRRKSTAGGGAACLVLVLAEGQVAGRGTTASARGEPAQRRCLLGSANLGVRGKHVIAAQ